MGEMEPSRDDVLMAMGYWAASMGVGPFGGPDERAPLLRSNLNTVVSKLGFAIGIDVI